MLGKVRGNPAVSGFGMPVGGDALANSYYKIEDGHVVIVHIEVRGSCPARAMRRNQRTASPKIYAAMDDVASPKATSRRHTVCAFQNS
jgi:hypothetical protein